MRSSQVLAYLMIGVGTVALLSRVGPGTGWLWVALAATGFLAAYRKEGTYALLVVGGVLAGVAAGFLLEGAWGWHGAFLMSVGAGFLLIDRVEPRESRWPIYPAAVFVGVGLVYWLFRAGILQSFWFPFLMIVFGVYLLRRNEGSGWVQVGEDASTSENSADASATSSAEEDAGAPEEAASPSGDDPRRENAGGYSTGDDSSPDDSVVDDYVVDDSVVDDSTGSDYRSGGSEPDSRWNNGAPDDEPS